MPATPAQRTTDAAARFARAVALERTLHAEVGEVLELPFGRAHLDPAVGRCYDRNLLWVFDDAGLEAARLGAEADRILGGAGLAHRQLAAEDPAGARLAPGLEALGYTHARHLVMAFAPDAAAPEPVAGIEVGPASQDELAEAYDRWLREDPAMIGVAAPEVRRALVGHQRTYAAAGAAQRRHAVRDANGRVVAWARSWGREGTWQVEDVVVQLEHRGCGLGRAVTAAATRRCLAEDQELVFIVADAADWPHELYRRMGFTPVGVRHVFTRV